MKANLECCQTCTRRMRFGNCAIRAPRVSVDNSGVWCYSHRAPGAGLPRRARRMPTGGGGKREDHEALQLADG